MYVCIFFFNDQATAEFYPYLHTRSLHDALPISIRRVVDLPDEVRSRYDTSSLTSLLANAAPWPFELKKKYVERINDHSLFEIYGSTELGVNTILIPDEQMRKPGSCGRPVPGVDIVLVDDEGKEITEPMVAGELFVSSDATFATD